MSVELPRTKARAQSLKRLEGSGYCWITFDPTNRSVGGFNLVPVAVGRDIRQIVPVAGSFVGMTDAFLDMAVEVSVKS